MMTPTLPHDASRPSKRTLRHLWAKMTHIYAHTWVSRHGTSPEHGPGPHVGELTDAGAVWQAGLVGITPAQIEVGISSAMLTSSEFPPNLPGFRKLCLGIPSLATVQTTLMRANEQPPELAAFLRLVWRFVGSQYRLARANEDLAEKMVARAYDMAVEYRMALGELPPAPVAALASPKKRTLTREELESADKIGRANLEKMAQILRVFDAQDDNEPREGE